MADLNIPNLNMNSDKYIFKKKLSLRRKSKGKLFTESAFMFFMSIFLVFINYLIPNKNLLLKNLPINFDKSFSLIIEISKNLLDLFLVIFIFFSLLTALLLMLGSIYRLFRVFKRGSKQINYK